MDAADLTTSVRCAVVLALHSPDRVAQAPAVEVGQGRRRLEFTDHRKQNLLLLGHVGFQLTPEGVEHFATSE